MRKKYLVPFVALLVLLLAVGALPQFLKSGDPFHVSATEADAPTDVEPLNASTLSERRYPNVRTALDDGRSDPYWKGPVGVKEEFTHSPFDELDALSLQYPNATVGDAVYVRYENATYVVAIEEDA